PANEPCHVRRKLPWRALRSERPAALAVALLHPQLPPRHIGRANGCHGTDYTGQRHHVHATNSNGRESLGADDPASSMTENSFLTYWTAGDGVTGLTL